MKYSTIAPFALLLLFGCSATGPVFTLPQHSQAENKSYLFIFRPDSIVAGAQSASILLDGARVVDLKNNGYIQKEITPGPHVISMYWNGMFNGNKETGEKQITIPFTVIPKGNNFVRVSISVKSGGYNAYEFQWQLAELNPTAGLEGISSCRQQLPLEPQK